ncbi:MAG: hypothetical protein AAFN44_01835 [Pseudomonadota bacterium]
MKQLLNALRASRPDCHVVAYGDATAQLILRASHEPAYRREHLDHLCEQAATSFDMLQSVAATWHNQEPAQEPAQEAIVINAKTTTLFVREGKETSEFLCMVSATGLEIESLVTDGRRTLSLISADL